MHYISTKNALLLILFVAIASVAGAHTGSCRGIVYDGNSQRPLDGASIYLKQANVSTITDAFGKFLIKDLKPGRYDILINYIAYTPGRREIIIEDGITTDIVVHLAPSAVTIKEVSINAKKDLNLGAISGVDLKLRPVNSTQDLMRLVPGLFTSQHQGGGQGRTNVFARL